MKLCKNCKHASTENASPGYWKCFALQNLKNTKYYGVDKEEKIRWPYCSMHREDSWLDSLIYGTCGRRGRWYEEKTK